MFHTPRHIQDYGSASSLEPHWGYADRVRPCTNDAGSCEYLDLVYAAHDQGMLYSGILYAVLGGILLVLAFAHVANLRPSRLSKTLGTAVRRVLGPSAPLRSVFGRTTRLQLTLLAALTAYLTIFTFAGMQYRKWITPVKAVPGVNNTRTTLGPLADRVGLLAYALTPVSILLGARESLLSAATGIPYQHFNFLHRWTGHIILLQAVVHTIGWCIVELKLYQPQPKVGVEWIKQSYMIWGVVALALLLLLWVLALPISRRKLGYETFRKAHYVLAMLYVGACWAHWAALKCFLLPCLVLWGLDRGIRLVRTALIHYRVLPDGHGVFSSFPAKVTQFDGVVRLDLDPRLEWLVGQHYYLTFPAGSIWQSHPFTPLSQPGEGMSFVLRAKSGETARVAALNEHSTPVILTGPCGADITRGLSEETNVLCVAGGTGISFVLPVLLLLAQRRAAKVQLLWVMRHARDTAWIAPELATLLACGHVSVVVHSTRDGADDEIAGSLQDKELSLPVSSGRPDLDAAIETFLRRAVGPSVVYVSGPGGMIAAMRDKVAASNRPGAAWRGDDEAEVRLVYDDRLE